MNSTRQARWSQIFVWCFWFVVLLTLTWQGGLAVGDAAPSAPGLTVALLVVPPPAPGTTFPWQPRGRWRKWAALRYRAARRAYQRAVWAARGARLLLGGALTMAAVWWTG